jgi:hypothetical protein
MIESMNVKPWSLEEVVVAYSLALVHYGQSGKKSEMKNQIRKLENAINIQIFETSTSRVTLHTIQV